MTAIACGDAVANDRRSVMDTKQLRTFMTIADMQSFTRAGRRLGLSQSAISQQVSALEKQLGVQLLVRAGGSTRPTDAGEMLLRYARQILGKVDEAQRVLADYGSTPGGVLRLGAGPAACQYLLPQVLKEFHDRFPRIELQVRSGHTALTLERLLDGELDLGIVSLPVAHAKLRIHELGRDELVAIAAPGHPWAERKRVQPGDFAGQALLVYERRSRTFQLIERLLFEAGVFPRIAMEMDHLNAVTAMVRMGLGVAIVPRWAVRAELAAGQLCALAVGKAGLSRPWGLALVEQPYQPQAQRAFVRLCTERVPAMLAA
jgi:DNA-binding transcriptional LysR family regulator